MVEHLDGAFTRFSEGNGAFVDARAFDAAEERRRRLVADLDAQVRAKREQKRLQSLREELEDAKIERRIQEVIEQERLEREMKERLLERPDDLAEYRVANSPRASVANANANKESLGLANESLGLDAAYSSRDPAVYPTPIEGATSEGAPSADPASTGVDAETYAETYEGAVVVHAEDESLRRGGGSAAEDPSGEEDADAPPEAHPNPSASEPEALKPKQPAPLSRELPADDDASARPPSGNCSARPRLARGGPRRVDSTRDKTSSPAASRALEYANARESPETFPAPSTFPAIPRDSFDSFEGPSLPSGPSLPAGEPVGSSRRVATPLDVKIEKLQMALERRDVDLESARDEARRLERERDLAERERDLEHQLHKIRTEMAAGGALGTAAARAAAGDAVSAEFRRDASKLGGRSFVGTDVASFVVRSGFVRADAPIGVSESQAMRGGDFNALVPEGYTVRPGEARRSAAPRVAGLQRRAARGGGAGREGWRAPRGGPRRTTRARVSRAGRCGARTARPRRAGLGGEPRGGTGGREETREERRYVFLKVGRLRL